MCAAPYTSPRVSDFLKRQPVAPRWASGPCLIAVLESTGVGPEVFRAALAILEPLAFLSRTRFAVEFGGLIGEAAESVHGAALPENVVAFCADVLRRGGAILSGPGGRYVYDLRRRFDSFCEFVPIKSWS